jgi:hypothetical protein
MEPWSIQYARSLSAAQWTEEIGTRFVQAIADHFNSLPLRDPIATELARYGAELDREAIVEWNLYSVSIRGELTEFTFVAWFFATVPPWSQPEYGLERPAPILVNEGGQEVWCFAFDGLLYIDNAGNITSDKSSGLSTDPDLLSPYLDEDAIFGLHN